MKTLAIQIPGAVTEYASAAPDPAGVLAKTGDPESDRVLDRLLSGEFRVMGVARVPGNGTGHVWFIIATP